MKKFTLSITGILLGFSCLTFAQAGEFEGTLRVTSNAPTLELYDVADSRVEGRIKELFNTIEISSLRGDLRLGTSTNGVVKQRLNIKGNNGNVGIGTTGPSAMLDIRYDSALNSAHLELDETQVNDYSRIKFKNSGNSGEDYWDFAARANGNNSIVSGATNSRMNMYYKFKDNGPGYDYLSVIPFAFLGEYLASFKFRGNLHPVKDNLYGLGTSSLRWGTIYAANGTIQTSDIRAKKNVETISYGLDHILKLKPVSYNWKDSRNTKTKLGLIAQEVLEVIPEIVNTTELVLNETTGKAELKETELMGMDYSSLIPVLIKSIQEQQVQIDLLKAEIRSK